MKQKIRILLKTSLFIVLLVIFPYSFAIAQDAGSDQTVCTSNTFLDAAPAEGYWTTTPENAIIVDPTLYNTEVTQLRWPLKIKRLLISKISGLLLS